MKDCYAIILAAGKGTGMVTNNQEFSKVSYRILGKPLINFVLDAAKPLINRDMYVVVGHGGNSTIRCVGNDAKIVWQKEILGTGHAVKMGADELKDVEGDVFIINGDTPLLTSETLKRLYNKHEKSGDKLTICTCVLENPNKYGRIVRELPSHKILRVVPDAEIEEGNPIKEISEVNSGLYVVDNQLLQKYLAKLSTNNSKKEYYFSDVVKMFVEDGHQVSAYVLESAEDVYNINNRMQLAYAAKIMKKRINKKLMLEGVSIEDPYTTYISPDVKIGRDSYIFPNTIIFGDCDLGEFNVIGPNTTMENVKAGSHNKIIHSYVKNVTIGDYEEIGPFEKR